MLERDLAYAAGYLEADGCITVESTGPQGRYVSACVRVTSVDPEVPNWLRATFGGGIHQALYRTCERLQYRWHIVSRQAESFLKAVQPYLKLERKQKAVELVLELLSMTASHSQITTWAHHDPEYLAAYMSYRKMYQRLVSELSHKGPERNMSADRGWRDPKPRTKSKEATR